MVGGIVEIYEETKRELPIKLQSVHKKLVFGGYPYPKFTLSANKNVLELNSGKKVIKPSREVKKPLDIVDDVILAGYNVIQYNIEEEIKIKGVKSTS